MTLEPRVPVLATLSIPSPQTTVPHVPEGGEGAAPVEAEEDALGEEEEARPDAESPRSLALCQSNIFVS